MKMPADGTPISRARAHPHAIHWYTGQLQNDFMPVPVSRATSESAAAPDPCRALRISWDNDTPALIARQPAFHPWQVGRVPSELRHDVMNALGSRHAYDRTLSALTHLQDDARRNQHT